MSVMIGNKAIKVKVSHCLGSVSNGNTNNRDTKVTRNRARTWCFTLNNYTENDLVSLSHNKWKEMRILKCVFQEEIGKSGTKHLQGVVQFSNQTSFTSLKEFHGKVRWSKCRNIKASIKYCSKQETRNGELYKHGDVDKWIWKDKPKLISTDELYKDMKKQMIEDSRSIWDDPELKGISMSIGEPSNGGVEVHK